MIKKMFVEVQVEEGKTVTVELNMVADGISAMHAYFEDSDGQYSVMQPLVKVLWENEEGMRAYVENSPTSKDSYIDMIVDNEFFKNNDFHMWNVQPYKNTFYEVGTPAWKKYDLHCPFLFYGIGTVGSIITRDKADELALNVTASVGQSVEDYEVNQFGHVYSMDNGATLTVKGNGEYYFTDMPDYEQEASFEAFQAEQQMDELVDSKYGKVEEVLYDEEGPYISDERAEELRKEAMKPLNGEEV